MAERFSRCSSNFSPAGIVFSTIHHGTQLSVLSWEFILGVRWYDIPTLSSLERYRQAQSQHLRRWHDKSSSPLIVSYADASADFLSFESGLREAVEQVLTDTRSSLMGMAQIVLGEGFAATSVRSVLSGIQLAIRPNYPLRQFSNADPALVWLEDLLSRNGHANLASELGTGFLQALEDGLEISQDS